MPAKNNVLALTVLLALAALPPAAPKRQKLRHKRVNNRVLRGRDKRNKSEREGALEEDVAFWTNMARRTQMSVPPTPTPVSCCDPAEGPGGCPDENGSFDNCWDEGGYCCSDGNWYAGEPIGAFPNSCEDRGLEDSQACDDAAPTPTPPTDVITPMPTDVIPVDPGTTDPTPAEPVPTPAPFDDGSGGTPADTPMPVESPTAPSNPNPGTSTPPPVPVVGVVCVQGETCTAVGDTCTDGSTEECCGETFESFVCECADTNGELTFQCMFTEACKDKVCVTPAPVPGDPPAAPVPTPAPIDPTGGFQCPDPNVVGCTAVDPNNFADECDALGEPCPNANAGEFCCQDGCPRNYCTAKQKPMSLAATVPLTTEPANITDLLPVTEDMSREVKHALKRIKRQQNQAANGGNP